VTRRDQPQPTVEVMRLRPVARHAPASITSSTTAVRTSRSRCLPPSQHVHHALAQRNYHRVPRVKGIPKSPRHINSRTRISNPHNVAPVPRGFVLGRFPYAGPMPLARSAMAGIRKPSPSRSVAGARRDPETGHSAKLRPRLLAQLPTTVSRSACHAQPAWSPRWAAEITPG
jgi:hypothetical protein